MKRHTTLNFVQPSACAAERCVVFSNAAGHTALKLKPTFIILCFTRCSIIEVPKMNAYNRVYIKNY